MLPKGEIMMTAKIAGDEIKLLKNTIFPSNKRYCISENGLAACLDTEKKIILYGRIDEQGGMTDINILQFPSIISPKSICVINNHLILGGENNHTFNNDIKSNELVVTYSIARDKYSTVEMPFNVYEKCIDDLLLDEDKVIAVDNVIYPKYLIEYDFKNPDYPHLIVSHSLPNNGTYEHIGKGTLNYYYIALMSSSFGQSGVGKFINIFIRGSYDRYLRLAQWYDFTGEVEIKKEYHWCDILLLPEKNVLLISSMEDGIGIYYINESAMDPNRKEDYEQVQYTNNWGQTVIKTLLLPQLEDKILIIFRKTILDQQIFSYALESIDKLLSGYIRDKNYFIFNTENVEYGEFYNDFGNPKYCAVCQQSPCLCSDKGKSSTK